jgi:hypothetical protein
MSKSKVSATKQVTKAVEEIKVETKVETKVEPKVETKTTKQTKVVEQPKVVEEPKVELKHETDHEEEHEGGEKKKKAMTFETSLAADEEIEKIDSEVLRLSKLRITYEKERKKLLTKEMRQSRSKKSDRPKAGSKSGFNKPQSIPENIKYFLNTFCKEEFRVAADDLKPRTWITKAIYSYIHDNKLTAENNGRKIIANKVLADLFGVEEKSEVTFESFQTMVSQAFKLGQESDENDEESGSGEEQVVEVKKSATKVATK